MELCNIKKMMPKVILAMVLIGIGLLMFEFGRGRETVVSAAETTSTNNTVDVKVVRVSGDLVKKEEIYKADGTEQMLFAGWYTDAACNNAVTKNTTIKSSSNYYAKYVDAKTLSIKLQLRVNSNETTDIRIVSSVDCLDYESVGFDVYFNNGEKISHIPFETKTVQKRINVTSEGVSYDFSPKVIDSASEYFVSATIKNIAKNKRDCDFHIKPYWVTTSGAKVYGQSRYFSTADGLDAGNINIPVEMAKPVGTSIEVNIDNQPVNAELAYYEEETGCAHLNIPVNDRTQLPAATKIQVSNDVQAIYRNYISSSIDIDTSWYDVNTESNEFVIAKKADLKGLASLVNNGKDLFEDKTIIMVTDIVINEGTVASGTNNWEKWTPIGKADNGKRFAGTFEADNNTISGIYMTNTTVSGLFGGTETGSVIQNLRLAESYFSVSDRSKYQLGSVVADCHGSLDNVYSDAVIYSAASNTGSDMNTGGLVATLDAWDYQNNCTGTISITNCWYEGTITLGDKTICAGGIVGDITKGAITMDTCLFTGKILNGNTLHAFDYVGGFFGDISESTYETTVNITACISAGEIDETWEAVDPGTGVGAIGGYFSFAQDEKGTAKSIYLNLDNVYATRDCFAKAVTAGSRTHTVLDADGNAITDANGDAITAETIVTGTPIWTYNNDRLVGYCAELTGEKLDFAKNWVLRTKGVPVPQTMEDVVGFSNIVESKVSLEEQVGMDLFGKKVSAATNMGAGNYVHTITGKTYEDYQSYINRLKELDFKAHVSLEDGTETDDGTAIDGVYNAVYAKKEGNWSLSITYVENLETLYVTIHTGGVESLSPHLIYDSNDKNRQHDMAGEVSFTMSQLTKEGNQFILRLPNGHFIINDGGHSTELKPMLETLKIMAQEVGMQEVYIDAWMISHQHVDHAGVLSYVNTLVKEKQQSILENVYVEGIYLSEPNYQTQLLEGTGGMDNVLSNQYLGMRWLKNSDREQTPIYRYNTGQRYYFSGVCLDVIQSQEVLPIHDKTVWAAEGLVNAVSTTFVYTMNNDEKIFWSGDATHLNSDYIMKAYGSVEEGETLSKLLYEPKTILGYEYDSGTLSVDSLANVVTGINKVKKSSQMLSGIRVYITPHHGTSTTLPFSNWLATNYGEMVDGNYQFDTVLFPYDRFRMTGEGEMAGTDNAPNEETQDYANEWLRDHLVGDGGMHHYGDGPITLTFEKIDTSEGEDTDEPNWSLPF